MKTIFTSMLLLIFMTAMAQDKIYVHTATAANISDHITHIDHPDLNGNPDAAIVYINNFNPNSVGGVYNNHVSGLWYNGVQWTIYNEDMSPMVEGASFNVYIASDPSDVITHVATASNIFGHITDIDDARLNGRNPGPYIAFSHYYNPNSIYNTGNYGQYYTGEKRSLYDEGITPVPPGAAFKILINGEVVNPKFTHVSTAANILSNWTTIDDPALNGNPNARFVMSHYWGMNGVPSQVYLDQVLGVWYDGNNWCIYIEDTNVDFPENVVFDIITAPEDILSVEENQVVTNVSMFPNPANERVNFIATDIIENIKIFNLLGQEILSLNTSDNSVQMDISSLSEGVYLARVKTAKGSQTLKLIKE